MMEPSIEAHSIDVAAIIVAVGTLVTALTATVVTVANLFRGKRMEDSGKRIEDKIDAGAQVQGEIHTAVNGGKALLLAEIADLKDEVRRLSPSGEGK